MHPIGLASIAFRQLSAEEILSAAKSAGLQYIEWGSDVHAPKDDPATLDRVAQLTREAGLQISSYGTYFRINRNTPEELLGYIHAAKRLGTNILRIWCSGEPNKLSPEELEARYEKCRVLAQIAWEHGVLLCAECHSDTLTDNAQSSLALLQAVNSPALRMYWQPNKHMDPEQNLAFAAQVAPFTVHVHMFNIRDSVQLPLADAVEDWKKYAQALGTNHIYLLEHLPNDDVALLPSEAAAIRQILSLS